MSTALPTPISPVLPILPLWKRPQVIWPGIVVFLLAIPIVANFYLMYRAKADPAFFVEKDYYKKAVSWDQARAQTAQNLQLGWQVQVQSAGHTGQSQTLLLGQPVVVTLKSSAGQPMAGAQVAVEAFHNARAGDRMNMAATTDAAGQATLALPWTRPGLHELQLTIVAGKDTFTQTIQRDVAK